MGDTINSVWVEMLRNLFKILKLKSWKEFLALFSLWPLTNVDNTNFIINFGWNTLNFKKN